MEGNPVIVPSASASEMGKDMHALISDLYPICRSLTGDGVRKTLKTLQSYIPMDVHEVPSGTPVFDWTIPKEWNIRDAYIANAEGKRLVDFKQSSLHVLGYSVPVRKNVSLTELKEHVFTLPDHPDWIPYRTSYYSEDWGFCLSHEQLVDLQEGEYQACIDASLEDGFLTYGEYYLRGYSDDEVIISTHICHPSLANDNLSGIAVATFLAVHLKQLSPRYSYRFLFLPGTIGAIAWLCRNEASVSRIKHGLVLAGVGDSGNSTYKRSRKGDAEIDRAVTHVLRHSGQNYEVMEFSPHGYDERQYCSPGFNLPVGCLMRTPHGRYPEYHTSADDLSFVQPMYLADSFEKGLSVIDILENNKTYVNQQPKCEPQLGKRGLYRSIGASGDGATNQHAMLWVLNLSDGNHSLLDIAEKADVGFGVVKSAANALEKHGLLKEAPMGAQPKHAKKPSQRSRKRKRRESLL